MTDRPYWPELPGLLIEDAVRAALQEDLGRAGDLTAAATIAPDREATATFNARDGGVICGLPMAKAAFRLMDLDISFEQLAHDGDRVEPGTAIARVSGKARAILSAERTALNYLMHLSGIATATSHYVNAIQGSGARVCCTRKTVPGLRAFQKYAVRCGGGANHRFGLDDAVLIKDNHIAVAGGLTAAIERARAYVGHLVCIEIEVDTLDQLAEALTAGADVILLDNMGPQTLEKAVRLKNEMRPPTRLEASGGISIETIAAIAATGVDLISTSKITMATAPLDIGLDIQLGA
ncbi:carboxylating nicotinate-nucleotide diphosphorylase [Georhizobium profundi]|uniref:Probable nicotinate-nucleotide pyrophosphorylase [carboxylating] n=1 Tax=Georhizobium profundi TaxID=2341112 RepID=A0A3S9B6B9_9HYPH|nr:carboxylating nicotinate-nucleotide diphosphorylase [Georhizobium profundi]AZN72489.1 carboxylating nicotinate-nucleotide diphosphorylase [Georhizobium profundi]